MAVKFFNALLKLSRFVQMKWKYFIQPYLACSNLKPNDLAWIILIKSSRLWFIYHATIDSYILLFVSRFQLNHSMPRLDLRVLRSIPSQTVRRDYLLSIAVEMRVVPHTTWLCKAFRTCTMAVFINRWLMASTMLSSSNMSFYVAWPNDQCCFRSVMITKKACPPEQHVHNCVTCLTAS